MPRPARTPASSIRRWPTTTWKPVSKRLHRGYPPCATTPHLPRHWRRLLLTTLTSPSHENGWIIWKAAFVPAGAALSVYPWGLYQLLEAWVLQHHHSSVLNFIHQPEMLVALMDIAPKCGITLPPGKESLPACPRS